MPEITNFQLFLLRNNFLVPGNLLMLCLLECNSVCLCGGQNSKYCKHCNTPCKLPLPIFVRAVLGNECLCVAITAQNASDGLHSMSCSAYCSPTPQTKLLLDCLLNSDKPAIFNRGVENGHNPAKLALVNSP